MPTMELDVSYPDAGAGVLTLKGRLNMASAPALREAASALVDDGRSRVAVDLREVSFLDSSGLGALIGAMKGARAAGGDLRLVGPTEQVQMVLKLTNLDRVLVTADSVEGATAA